IYRGVHQHSIISIDQSSLDQIEILSGPGSVMYGSDAIGGVIHLSTHTPRYAEGENEFGGRTFVRYSSAAMEKTAHVDSDFATRKLAATLSITASDFGDLRQGSTRNPFYEDHGRRLF